MTREEAIKVLSESIHDGSKVPWDKIVEAVHLSIEALSQPSLPSNLDEAAEKEAYGYCVDNKIGKYCGAAVYDAYESGYKAGAEWIAEQGVSMLGKVGIYGVDVESITKELREAGFNLGEEIILQIRKK